MPKGVCFWGKADMPVCAAYVPYWPKADMASCTAMSAFDPKRVCIYGD